MELLGILKDINQVYADHVSELTTKQSTITALRNIASRAMSADMDRDEKDEVLFTVQLMISELGG